MSGNFKKTNLLFLLFAALLFQSCVVRKFIDQEVRNDFNCYSFFYNNEDLLNDAFFFHYWIRGAHSFSFNNTNKIEKPDWLIQDGTITFFDADTVPFFWQKPIIERDTIIFFNRQSYSSKTLNSFTWQSIKNQFGSQLDVAKKYKMLFGKAHCYFSEPIKFTKDDSTYFFPILRLGVGGLRFIPDTTAISKNLLSDYFKINDNWYYTTDKWESRSDKKYLIKRFNYYFKSNALK